MTNNGINFEPLSDIHFPLLLNWLEKPHVKAWWDQDINWTIELIKEKYGSYVKGYKPLQISTFPEKSSGIPSIGAFIIFLEKTPIGYIQYYNVHDFPREDNQDISMLPLSCAGIDLYIGEAEFLNKNIGSSALKYFIMHYIFPTFDYVFVDPDISNKGAIRAYEKAGFRVMKDVGGSDIVWMLCSKFA